MYRKISIFSLCCLFLVACDTKIDINGDYEEVPIVHFLLDQGQEYQFLKLNKTFLKDGNSLEHAKNQELSYFNSVTAVVEEVKNGNTIREWILKDTIIHNKSDGVFYAPDQKLYYFRATDLDENAIYRLKIDIDNGNHIVTGQSNLVRGVKINSPQKNQSFNLADNDVNVNGYKGTPIIFSQGDGAAFKLQVNFYYREHFNSGQKEDKSVLWNIGEISSFDMSGTATSIIAKGESFYELLSNRIIENPSVTKRTVLGMEIVLTASSDDLQTYILSNSPSSSLAQNKPVYSNVEGGLGIFSSRVTVKQFKDSFIEFPHSRCLNINSTRELCIGKYTMQFKFCSDIPNDAAFPFFCG